MAGFPDEASEYLEMLDDGLLAFESKVCSEAISLSDPDNHEQTDFAAASAVSRRSPDSGRRWTCCSSRSRALSAETPSV